MVRPYQVTKMMDGPLNTREQFVDQIVYSLEFYVNIITIVQSWPVLCNSSFECWNRLVTAHKALKVPLDYKPIRKLCIRIRLRRIASCYGCYGWNTDCISKRSNTTWALRQAREWSLRLGSWMNDFIDKFVNWMLIKSLPTCNLSWILLRFKYIDWPYVTRSRVTELDICRSW